MFTKATRLGKGRAGLALAALLVVAAGGVAFGAPSKPIVPTPTITSMPTNPTRADVASFTYSDTLAGVTYACSLDGANPKGCPTAGMTYAGLPAGSHTFAVVASSPGRTTSAPASSTWTIDRTAPAIVISSPGNGGSYRSASWPPCGICGTAADPSGVAGVRLSVFQQSTNRYWSGTAFDASAALTVAASGTTGWAYGFGMPEDGRYVVSVFATDGLGNVTPAGGPVTSTFTVDNVAPPAAEITKAPADPSTSTSPQFQYSSAEAKGTFRCSLDDGPFAPCPSGGMHYSDIEEGDHCFAVEATDAAGNTGPPSPPYCWTILLNKTFGIKGQVVGSLRPGASRLIDLELTNPYNFTISVHTAVVTIGESSNEQSCPGTTNLENTRSLIGPVAVPANATKKLSELAIPEDRWPQVRMPNLDSSQDGCKGATFELSYSGTASK